MVLMPKKTQKSPVGPTKNPQAWGDYATDDQVQAFDHFKTKMVSIADPQIARGDTKIMLANVEIGVASFRGRAADIQKKLPDVNLAECLECRPLALALDYAAGRVAQPASEKEIEARLKLLRPLREIMLKQLDVFAYLKLVPAERVKAIRAGTGPLDSADDGVKINGIFHEFAGVLANKQPFPQATIEGIGALGNWLIANITPSGAQSPTGPRNPDAILRDQFFTELSRRYDVLREASVVVAGLRNLDEFAPPLFSRVHAPQVTDPTPPAAPEPPKAVPAKA